MPRARRANETNLPPHWKVRISVRKCGLLHTISSTEPVVYVRDGEIYDVDLSEIEGTEYGDTIGFIDWSEVSAVTWRYAPLVEEKTVRV